MKGCIFKTENGLLWKRLTKHSFRNKLLFQKAPQSIEHHFIEHRANLNIILQTLKELECVQLLVIELKHPNSGFEQTNIKPDTAFTRFTKLLMEQTRTSFIRTSNRLECVHLLVIELENPILCFKWLNI